VAGGTLNRQVSITTWLPFAPGGTFMRQRSRGWFMPEADMRSMLRLIDEKIRSRMIDVRHQDVLIRLRESLENDLNDLSLEHSSSTRIDDEEAA
jgi:hypothetical protein